MKVRLHTGQISILKPKHPRAPQNQVQLNIPI
jgi:hypothetical protein